MKATEQPKCNGCTHRDNAEPENFCYMFQRAPDRLPCGQHDMYADKRRETARRFHRNPMLLAAALVAGMSWPKP